MKAEAPRRVRRGVRELNDVPDYLVREAFAEMGNIDLAFFVNQDANENKTFFLWVMGEDEKFKVFGVSVQYVSSYFNPCDYGLGDDFRTELFEIV